MNQRMIGLSGILHLVALGCFIGFNGLSANSATPAGAAVYPVDLVTLQGPPSARRLPTLDEPYRMVSRKEAAAPNDQTDLALKRTPKLVAEEPKKGPSAAPSFETATPGVRLDVEAFQFPYYLSAIHRKIQENFVVPRLAGVGTLQAVISFRIGRDGKIYDLTVEQPSENPTFDSAAQRALQAANPLPPLPSEYDPDYLSVHFAFEYNP